MEPNLIKSEYWICKCGRCKISLDWLNGRSGRCKNCGDRYVPPSPAEIDLSRCRYKPFPFQVQDIRFQVEHPVVFNTNEMGCGKSKEAIDTACILFIRDIIHRVIILAPSSVVDVWIEEELGQLADHLWDGLPATIQHYRGSKSHVWKRKGEGPPLQFLVTNYEFIRGKKDRLKELLRFCDSKTLMICDESANLKSRKTLQTKAAQRLRDSCGRVILLNGTPITQSPNDLYSQGNLLTYKILDCTYVQFRAKYAIMGGWQGRQIVRWQNLDDLQQKFAPYVIRRLKKDVLKDLPEKLRPVTWPVTLTETTWKAYRKMRDDLVVWLNNATISTASQAAVRVIRLSQVTSGFLGGVHDAGFTLPDSEDVINDDEWKPVIQEESSDIHPVQIIGNEKIQLFMERLAQALEENPKLKWVVWTRFRPELAELLETIAEKYPLIELGEISGGQKRSERFHALRILDPRTTPDKAVVVCGTPQSGSLGLNLTAADTVIYISNDYSLKTRLQSEDRVHRPGQIRPVNYYDIIAYGPNGQKTVDHAVIKALHDKQNVAAWITKEWITALTNE